MGDEAAIDAIAVEQHGLITRAQLLVGMSVWQVESRLRRGLIVRVRPSVYRCRGVPKTWPQEVLAVTTHRGEVSVADITGRLHIPVTTVERTLIDLSSVTSTATLERAVDDALRQGHTTIAKLGRKVTLMPAGGRRRLRALRRLVADRGTDYRAGDSDWEDRLYRWIVTAGLAAASRGR